MRSGLTIGDFSQITHLSVKTLRHYHDTGLLEPVDIDPQSGYRYYTIEQVPTAQVIRRFRDLGMPVREVREVLAATDPAARSALIADYLQRLENQLDETRAAVTSLRRLLAPTAPPVQVELRAQPPTTVASISALVDRADILAWYGDAMAELRDSRGPRRLSGPAGGLFDNELFTEDRGRAVVYLPMTDPPSVGRVTPFVIPAVELALTLHRGPHDDIDVSYGALGSWVAEHALAVAGPVHEIYLVGPADTASAADWRTEIGWPIFRTSPS